MGVGLVGSGSVRCRYPDRFRAAGGPAGCRGRLRGAAYSGTAGNRRETAESNAKTVGNRPILGHSGRRARSHDLLTLNIARALAQSSRRVPMRPRRASFGAWATLAVPRRAGRIGGFWPLWPRNRPKRPGSADHSTLEVQPAACAADGSWRVPASARRPRSRRALRQVARILLHGGGSTLIRINPPASPPASQLRSHAARCVKRVATTQAAAIWRIRREHAGLSCLDTFSMCGCHFYRSCCSAYHRCFLCSSRIRGYMIPL